VYISGIWLLELRMCWISNYF